MWGFLCFEVEVTSYQLWNTKYSPYQSYLHDRVKKLKSEGFEYPRIANKLNEEGLKTARVAVFVGASIYSILKKRDYEMDESIKLSRTRKRYRHLGSNIQTTTGDVTYAFLIKVTFLQTDVRCTQVHNEKRNFLSRNFYKEVSTISKILTEGASVQTEATSSKVPSSCLN